MKIVRFGLIGLGKISTRFASVLDGMEGVELEAIASSERSRSEIFAQKYHARKVYSSYENVITDPEVDVVYIGLTNNFHYEFIKSCLEHHKAVMCEKPLVTTLKEAQELIALANKNNTLLMEAMWTRCLPAYKKAREWVKKGKIGEVKLITANFCYNKKYTPEIRQYNSKLLGGSLFDVGVYPIFFTTGILSAHPEKVSGLAKITPGNVDESAVISMSFTGGTLASLSCGFNVNAKDEAVVYGTKGKLVLDNCFGPQICEYYNDEKELIERFEDRVADGFIFEIQHCADLFRQGKIESDLIPWADTMACAGIFDSLRSNWGMFEGQ
ncbi:MAG: Gfo/Idh/MocA family oxidoreductase [Chloroflexi bacterium]|nr:Gfo/Idh/MocA family oxidoreductase [Chloroflexota bacterium]